MAVRGVGDIQKRSMDPIGWGYGKISRGVGGFSSHTIFDAGDSSNIRLWHGMWSKFGPLKKLFRIYLPLSSDSH